MKFKEFYFNQLNESKFNFASTQIDLDPNLSNEVYNWGLKYIHDDVLDPKDGRQDVNDVHITSLYGIHTDDSQLVQLLIKLFSPFEIELGDIGLFKNGEVDIIKIDVKPNYQLTQIHNFLKNNLQNSYKFPEYLPHVTIAMILPDSCNHLEGNSYFNGQKINIDGITFSSKEGIKNKIFFYPKY